MRYWIRVDCARSERHRSKQRRAPAKSDWNERSEFILNSRPSPTGSARWWTRVCRFLAPCSRSSGSATPPSKCAAGGLGTKCGRVCGTRIYKKPRPGVGLMRLSTRPNSTRGGRKLLITGCYTGLAIGPGVIRNCAPRSRTGAAKRRATDRKAVILKILPQFRASTIVELQFCQYRPLAFCCKLLGGDR